MLKYHLKVLVLICSFMYVHLPLNKYHIPYVGDDILYNIVIQLNQIWWHMKYSLHQFAAQRNQTFKHPKLAFIVSLLFKLLSY